MHRRTVMTGMTGLAMSTFLPHPSKGAGTVAMTDPSEILKAHIKLRGSLDGAPVLWWLKGTQYGVVDGVFRPLYTLLNGSFQRTVQIEENIFEITMLELAYFTDLKTGEPMKTFQNPYTNEVGTVPPALFGPNKVSLTLDGLQPPKNFAFGDLSFEGELGPVTVEGDEIWLQEDTIVRMESENPAFGSYLYNELVTYHGRVTDIENDQLASAPATLTYNTTSNWRPWMKAGDTPGYISSRAYGAKIQTIDKFPADYLAIARKEHPEVIADPIKILDTPLP